MYMLKKDFDYFEELYKKLDEVTGRAIALALAKAMKGRAGQLQKIWVIDETRALKEGIAETELVSRKMIDEAYGSIKK